MCMALGVVLSICGDIAVESPDGYVNVLLFLDGLRRRLRELLAGASRGHGRRLLAA